MGLMGEHRIGMVIGTRPEAIKMAPLAKALRQNGRFSVSICLTGQHEEMAKEVLRQWGVAWTHELRAATQGATLCTRTAQMMTEMQEVFFEDTPDLLLVHGDTVSALAGGLSAFCNRIPVGHVEAGLRTYRYDSPFPEEFCRCAVDDLCAWHFAPTETAKERLLCEGRAKERIFVTGNTGLDAVREMVTKEYTHPFLDWVGDRPFVILTAHRRENWGRLAQIFTGVRLLCQAQSELRVLFPVHPNPLVQTAARAAFADCEGVYLSEPLAVRDFQNLLARCRFVLTDSGGLQEEAAFLGKRVLVLRDDTEREESAPLLVGSDPQAICRECCRALRETPPQREIRFCQTPYGDGFAALRIVSILQERWLGEQ